MPASQNEAIRSRTMSKHFRQVFGAMLIVFSVAGLSVIYLGNLSEFVNSVDDGLSELWGWQHFIHNLIRWLNINQHISLVLLVPPLWLGLILLFGHRDILLTILLFIGFLVLAGLAAFSRYVLLLDAGVDEPIVTVPLYSFLLFLVLDVTYEWGPKRIWGFYHKQIESAEERKQIVGLIAALFLTFAFAAFFFACIYIIFDKTYRVIWKDNLFDVDWRTVPIGLNPNYETESPLFLHYLMYSSGTLMNLNVSGVYAVHWFSVLISFFESVLSLALFGLFLGTIVERISGTKNSSGINECLFELDCHVGDGFDQGAWLEELRIDFQQQDRPLTDAATLIVIENGREWQIHDSLVTYLIRVENQMLAIYDVTPVEDVLRASRDILGQVGRNVEALKLENRDLQAQIGRMNRPWWRRLMYG